MQEMQHPNGTVSREFFTDEEVRRGKVKQRRKELEAQGYSYSRVAYIVKPSKYMPHQGAKEIERRAKRMAQMAETAEAL